MSAQFVVVLWNDAWIDATEPITLQDARLKHKPLTVKSFGWLLIEDEVGVTLASERYLDNSEHDIYRAATFIPRAMIKSVTPVNLSKKRAPKTPKTPNGKILDHPPPPISA